MEITYLNDKQRLTELCMRNIVRHLFGNTKSTLYLEAQFQYIEEHGTKIQKELIHDIMKNRVVLD